MSVKPYQRAFQRPQAQTAPRRQQKRERKPIHLKTPEEIALMRQAGRIAAEVHAVLRGMVKPGITTLELDRVAEQIIRDNGAIPTFIGYPKTDSPDYPASINASINHELVHGLPSGSRFLKEGDIISLDVGVTYQGFVADTAYTHPVGTISKAVQRLLDVTERALQIGIEASVMPNETRDVALTIMRYVQSQGYDVAREYTGHGVGLSLHEEPQVPNWWPKGAKAREFESVPLQPGMTYAIEPMVIAGRADLVELEDKWTVATKDRSLCAHFEHTILITDGKPEILTLP